MSDELSQLKFIASMFRMTIAEINNIMGEESLQTIFRLMGEKIGESVVQRLSLTSAGADIFVDKMVKEVLEPVLGSGGAEISVNGSEITVILKACPFQQAGIDISNKFYCTYTEGLIETAAKAALTNIEFKSLKLRASDNCDCEFKITL